jgi:serine/threonine protein kinase
MSTESTCPSGEDLEYYFQVRNIQSEDIRESTASLKKHIEACLPCKKRIEKLEKALRDFSETPTEDLRQEIAGCKLLEKIGGGATGEVFKAIKLSLNRVVAIKILRASTGLSQPERFQREAHTLARVDHINVANVYDYHISEDQQNYYLIMQFVDGENLEDYIIKGSVFKVEEAIPLWIQILEGLNALHLSGILHRDIKPSNLLIDQKQKIKIIDFGLAKPQSFEEEDHERESKVNLTMESTLLGTPNYMSPEACRGETQTYQSDLYSLGGVFYFSLTGRPPFDGKNIPDLIFKNVYKEPDSLKTKIPGFPQEIDQIILKMLAKTREQRFKNCQEILDALLLYAEKHHLDLKQKARFYRTSKIQLTPPETLPTPPVAPPSSSLEPLPSPSPKSSPTATTETGVSNEELSYKPGLYATYKNTAKIKLNNAPPVASPPSPASSPSPLFSTSNLSLKKTETKLNLFPTKPLPSVPSLPSSSSEEFLNLARSSAVPSSLPKSPESKLNLFPPKTENSSFASSGNLTPPPLFSPPIKGPLGKDSPSPSLTSKFKPPPPVSSPSPVATTTVGAEDLGKKKKPVLNFSATSSKGDSSTKGTTNSTSLPFPPPKDSLGISEKNLKKEEGGEKDSDSDTKKIHLLSSLSKEEFENHIAKKITKKVDPSNFKVEATPTYATNTTAGEAEEFNTPPCGITQRFSIPQYRQMIEAPQSSASFSSTKKNCPSCGETLAISQFFFCQKCRQELCEEHRKGVDTCHHCFPRITQGYPFYEKIYQRLYQRSPREQFVEEIEPKGETSEKIIAKIFHSFAYSQSGEGLLVIGTSHQKKGICFIDKSLLITSFGEKNSSRLGDLLIERGKLRREQLEEALHAQKNSSLKLGELLIQKGFIHEEILFEILLHQATKEILGIAQWKKSYYKFKPGKIPEDLKKTMKVDLELQLPRPVRLKKSLEVLFKHLDSLKKGGLFLFSSSQGSLGLLYKEEGLEFVNFRPKIPFSLKEELVLLGKIQEFQQFPPLEPQEFEEYLRRHRIVSEDEIQLAKVRYMGECFKQYLATPDFQCQWYEGVSPEILERVPEALESFKLRVDLQGLLYDILGRIQGLPLSLNAYTLYDLFFNQSSLSGLQQTLNRFISHYFHFSFHETYLSPFEAGFYAFSLLKFFYIEAFEALSLPFEVLQEEGLPRESLLFLEFAHQLFPNHQGTLKKLATTYERMYLNQKAVEWYKKLRHWALTSQEFIDYTQTLLRLDPSDLEPAYLLMNHFEETQQIQSALKLGQEIAPHLVQASQAIPFYWKLIQLEEPPRNVALREKLLKFCLEENDLKEALKALKELERALVRTRHALKLQIFYDRVLIFHSARAEELKSKMKGLKEGSIF